MPKRYPSPATILILLVLVTNSAAFLVALLRNPCGEAGVAADCFDARLYATGAAWIGALLGAVALFLALRAERLGRAGWASLIVLWSFVIGLLGLITYEETPCSVSQSYFGGSTCVNTTWILVPSLLVMLVGIFSLGQPSLVRSQVYLLSQAGGLLLVLLGVAGAFLRSRGEDAPSALVTSALVVIGGAALISSFVRHRAAVQRARA